MKNNSSKSFEFPHILVVLFIAVITFLVYLNMLGNDFVFDDKDLVSENPLVWDLKNIPRVFQSEFQLSSTTTGFYRPLILLSLIIDYQLWGLSPLGYHLSNLLIHLITSILVYFLALGLLRERGIAFWSSLIFALHPVHAANVAWVAGRGDSLCGMFYILTLVLFLKALQVESRGKIVFLLISWMSFFLALTAKEMAVTLPLLIILYFFCFQHKWKRMIVYCIPYFFVLGVYLYIRMTVLGQMAKRGLELNELPWRLVTMTDIIARYLGLLVFPARLNIYYVTPLIRTVLDPRVVLASFLLLVIAWFAVRVYRSSRPLFFAVLWFFITLLPIANIVPVWDTMMTEYWIYIPSFGFCLLLGIIARQIPVWRRQTVILLSGFLVTSALAIVSINRTWKDELTFYERMTTYAPGYYLGHYNLGNTYFRMDENELAQKEYEQAIDLNPYYSSSYVNLGGVYNKQHRFDEAIEVFKKALVLRPDDEEIKANIAIAQANKEKFGGDVSIKDIEKTENMEERLREAVEKNPDNPTIINNLGVFYAKAGRIDEALECFRRAVDLRPGDLNIYINLGNAYATRGQLSKAEKMFREVISRDPEDYRAYGLLAKLYKQQGEKEQAVWALENFLRYCPPEEDREQIKAEIEILRKE